MHDLLHFQRWHARGQFASPEMKAAADQCKLHVYPLLKNKGKALAKEAKAAEPAFTRLAELRSSSVSNS